MYQNKYTQVYIYMCNVYIHIHMCVIYVRDIYIHILKHITYIRMIFIYIYMNIRPRITSSCALTLARCSINTLHAASEPLAADTCKGVCWFCGRTHSFRINKHTCYPQHSLGCRRWESNKHAYKHLCIYVCIHM